MAKKRSDIDKRIKFFKGDRNEVRFHVASQTASVFYKDTPGRNAAYEIARRMVVTRP